MKIEFVRLEAWVNQLWGHFGIQQILKTHQIKDGTQKYKLWFNSQKRS